MCDLNFSLLSPPPWKDAALDGWGANSTFFSEMVGAIPIFFHGRTGRVPPSPSCRHELPPPRSLMVSIAGSPSLQGGGGSNKCVYIHKYTHVLHYQRTWRWQPFPARRRGWRLPPPIPLKKMGMALSIPLKKVELAPDPPKEESLHGALPPSH